MTATPRETATAFDRPLADAPAFIEAQFPVSMLSKESYAERSAGQGQTLTGLGKWWGRKPLVLVRAAILGLLLPATNDPEGDRDTFLTLMTMDKEGLLRRLRGSIPAATVYQHATAPERQFCFAVEKGKPAWRRGLSVDEKRRLQRLALLRMSYDEKLKYCVRPEEIDGPSSEAWERINAHLGTSAASVPELVKELGNRRFGHTPKVGDAFCGGGSIPFEAARIGCEAYGSDLSPVAALLTWGALNIVGGGRDVAEGVQAAQTKVFEAVKAQVDEWGIERNEDGWIADAYLYCNEVLDPNTGWRVPLAPSWVVAQGTQTVVRLLPDPQNRRFDFEVLEGATAEQMQTAAADGTYRGGVHCPVDAAGEWLAPSQRQVTSIELLRGRSGLRRWQNEDVTPRPDDTFQERLYCIRWVNPATGERRYAAPTVSDLERESRVLELLRERFADWQSRGYIPSRRIEPGYNTDQPVRERGWTHWHHLFNHRQLLISGLVSANIDDAANDYTNRVGLLLSLGRLINWNSRLSVWNVTLAKAEQTFLNQALNTLVNYGCRGTATLGSVIAAGFRSSEVRSNNQIRLLDARQADVLSDAWITDPGYGDAVNYDELSEFFLSWYERRIAHLFPDWYTDSKRALAVRGRDESFRQAMVECYRQFAGLMLDTGFQVVMFTHQDAEVWSDLGLIMWAAGLQVSAAWTVATEKASGVRRGNYIQGTVLLVLRKRKGNRRGDLSDLYPEVQEEVQRQLESMLALDDKDEPNFGDADYQLAAYAAALRVLTGYASIDEIDVERELYRTRKKGERSPLTGLIERAVKIASDVLVPDGLDRTLWRRLSPEERLYLKGVEIEAHGEYRDGVYQEFARGFGVGEYRNLLAATAANQTRLKTPSEFKGRDLRGGGFAGSLVRQVLFAVFATARDTDPRAGREYLRQELPDYWGSRQTVLALLRFLAAKPAAVPHWSADVEAARLLIGALENDSV